MAWNLDTFINRNKDKNYNVSLKIAFGVSI